MKNLQTGTTCLSSSTGSKQHKCRRSLQRLATFVILFLCSMTVSWAQETTTDKTCDLVIKKGVKEYISFDNSITATCTKNPSSGFNFSKGGNDAFTIKAKDATISKVSLWLKSDKSKFANVTPTDQEVNVTNGKMTVKWTNGNKNVEFTYSGTKNFTIYGATITYKYDKNLKLDNVYAPKITPDGTAVVGDCLDVQISDDQWEEAKAKNFDLKIHYLIEEGSNYGTGIVNNSTWTEVDKSTELPLTINLTKTSTISAYAEYTNSNNEAIKSDVVSNTYFLLDAKTTYLNTENTQDVGFTVKKNDMTMTYGGLKVGSENFTTLSKNENTDTNILGSNHTVSGNALYGTADVESELGDGKIGGENKSHEYLHCNASTKELHERTFALPAVGSFFKFEPEANGKLTVFVEQQGAIHNVNGTLHKEVVRKRPVYFLDETGKSIPANYAYTSSKVNKADWTEIQNTDNASNDNFYTKEYMDKLQAYYQNIIDGNNQDFTNFNSAVADADKRKALTLGTSIQPIIVLHEACNADILKGDGMSMSETGDTNYDHTGYMLISEGYVTYEFPVKAGKTYYLFASRTKLALSGFCFDKDPSYAATDVTLDGNADNTDAINKLEVDKQYNVTLNNRTFRSGRWYSVVLPFSVSQKQMKSVFGDGVKVLHYSDVTGTDLNLFEHFYQMIVGGTPVLVKPSKEVVTNPVFNNVTLTSQKVVDIENTGFKCTGSWNNVDFPAYSYFIDAKTNSFYLYDPTKVETNTVKPHAGAFRSWVIASENASTAKQLTMHINGIEEQGETTAIWNAISGNDDAEVASKGIYSLSGQKMNAADTSSLPKGIYIVNGKKFIVK